MQDSVDILSLGLRRKAFLLLRAQGATILRMSLVTTGRGYPDSTKAEILSGNLHKDRIIHRANWFNRIEALLN